MEEKKVLKLVKVWLIAVIITLLTVGIVLLVSTLSKQTNEPVRAVIGKPIPHPSSSQTAKPLDSTPDGAAVEV